MIGKVLIALVGVALAAAGTVDGVDAIVPWVFGIVDSIDWVDLWRPLYNPEPMDTYAYRPLSVVILKVALAIFGPSEMVLTALHGLVLVGFGLASRGFLLRHGFRERAATLASLSALMMPSLLFSAWICVEFDVFGAIFVLMAASALRDYSDGKPTLWRFWGCAAVALLTKETSALQLLAYLGAFTWIRRRERRWWKLSMAYVGLLLLATAPMHFVESANKTAFTLFSDGFHPIRIPAMLLHTGAQLVFVTSAAGILLLLSHVRQSRWLLGVLALALVLASPILRYYSHFEAVVFSSGPWAIGSFLLFCTAVGLALRRADTEWERTAWLTVVFTWAGYAAAPILLEFARADVSARIFAACVPIIHAAIWRELIRLWHRPWLERAPGMLLGTMFVGFVVSSAVNTTAFHRTRLMVETAAKRALMADLRMDCPAIVATNPVQLLTLEALQALGTKPLNAECAWIQTTSGQPESGQNLKGFIGAGGLVADAGQDAYLFIQTSRSRMEASVNVSLAGDFSWTQHLMPESDDDLYAAYQRMIYEIETDIETLFRRDGRTVADVTLPLFQLPLWWNEVPRRLVMGLPLIESYDYVARVYRIPARIPGYRPPGGRIRADQSDRGAVETH